MSTIRWLFRFGDFELDTGAYELRRKGRGLRLARQPMDLLLLLVEHPRALVSREEIATRLWKPGVFTDMDAGIHTAVLRIRQVLRDSAESPRFVETVPGKGYRFVAAVTRVPTWNGGDDAVTPERPAPARRDNLPYELTSFVGRRQALADVRKLMASSRLVTLIGTGGVGKTRLAARLVREVVPQFADGVWLIDLASLTAPNLIAQTIAVHLGIRESADRSEREALFQFCRTRALLLVLDTCEHLLDGCAELVETLLRSAPQVQILATSREPLRVPGEMVYQVPSLSLPDASASLAEEALTRFEATQLFVERARASLAQFTPAIDDVPAIVGICRHLDGIPLAIELAATHIAAMPPAEIEARLTDRFRLLSGSRTTVMRQRTLEATIDWSYQLLPPAQQSLFARLSTFAGSCSLEAAAAICGDGMDVFATGDLLSALVDKSLVVLERIPGGQQRYRLLDTMRQFAYERLVQAGEADRLLERHFRFFHAQFRDALPILNGHGQAAYLKQLHVEEQNLRTALAHGLSSAALAQEGVELAAALFFYWTKRGLFDEGRYWLERAVAVGAPGPHLARALIGLAHMAYWQGRLAEMAAHDEQALALARAYGDEVAVAFALFGRSLFAFETGDFERSAAHAEEARAADPAGGRGALLGAPLIVLGNLALVAGDQERALQHFDEAIHRQRQGGNAWGLAIVLSVVAGLHMTREEFAQAHAQAEEVLMLGEELEDPRTIAYGLDLFGSLLAGRGHAYDAAQLWGASDGLLERVGGSLVPTIGWIRQRYLEGTRESLGHDAFGAAQAAGRALEPHQTVWLARQQMSLGDGKRQRRASAP
jgi:non-specific serine/threonine protein kinase